MHRADPPGPTFLTYTPNGTRLITAGSNNIIRMFITGSDDEPDNVLDVQEQNAAVVAAVWMNKDGERVHAD